MRWCCNSMALRWFSGKISDGDSLYETVKTLLQDPETLATMGKNARKMAVVDAAEQIYGVICRLTQ